MDEQVGKGADGQEGLLEGGAGRLDAFGREGTLVNQQHVAGNRQGHSGRKAVQEVLQGRGSRNGRSGDAVGDAVVPHRAAAVHHHLLFFIGLLAVETQESALQAFHGRSRYQSRTHGIAGVRRGSGVQAHRAGLGLQGLHVPDHSFPAIGIGPKDFQEGAGIHRMLCLDGKGIVAVGDIGHSHHPFLVHLVHTLFQGTDLVFQGGGIAEGVDLVNEAGHTRTLAEEALHIGQFHVAVGVDHTGAEGAVQDGFAFLAQAGSQHYAVIVHFHIGIFQGKGRSKRIQISGSVSGHLLNFFLRGL